MRHTSSETQGERSLKTFFLFCLVVFLLILTSFSLRLFFLFCDSSFDGQHRYTLEIRHSAKSSDILTFEPLSSSLSIFSIESVNDTPSVIDTYGVPVDGSIQDTKGSVDKQNLLNKLYAYMFRITSGKGVNSLDIARLILFTHGIEKRDIKEEKITSPAELLDGSIRSEAFYDKAIVDEDMTIAIINAAGYPGLGSRIERILTSAGANVISVTTATDLEKTSVIEYTGEKSYTLSRVLRLVPLPEKFVDEDGISDILIVLGEDSIDPLRE